MVHRAPLLARGLLLVLVLALAATGFGHRFAPADAVARAQFAQLYGAEFCLTDEDGTPVDTAAHCPVCQVVAGSFAPEAVTGPASPAFARVERITIDRGQRVACAASPRAPPQRGPPLV